MNKQNYQYTLAIHTAKWKRISGARPNNQVENHLGLLVSLK